MLFSLKVSFLFYSRQVYWVTGWLFYRVRPMSPFWMASGPYRARRSLILCLWPWASLSVRYFIFLFLFPSHDWWIFSVGKRWVLFAGSLLAGSVGGLSVPAPACQRSDRRPWRGQSRPGEKRHLLPSRKREWGSLGIFAFSFKWKTTSSFKTTEVLKKEARGCLVLGSRVVSH